MMFVSLLRADDNGQYLPTISVEIMFFHIHGINEDGVLIDLVHKDRSTERVLVSGEYVMRVGEEKNVYTLSIVPHPTSGEILTKEEWQSRIKPWKVGAEGSSYLEDFKG